MMPWRLSWSASTEKLRAVRIGDLSLGVEGRDVPEAAEEEEFPVVVCPSDLVECLVADGCVSTLCQLLSCGIIWGH